MNRKILLIVLLLMVVVAKAELTEWRNIANTDFVTRITHDDEYINMEVVWSGLINKPAHRFTTTVRSGGYRITQS